MERTYKSNDEYCKTKLKHCNFAKICFAKKEIRRIAKDNEMNQEMNGFILAKDQIFNTYYSYLIHSYKQAFSSCLQSS